MDNRLKLFLIGYAGLVILYLIILIFTKRKDVYFRIAVMSLIPVFGVLFFIVIDIGTLLTTKKSSENIQCALRKRKFSNLLHCKSLGQGEKCSKSKYKGAIDTSDELKGMHVTSSDDVLNDEHLAFSDIMGIEDIKIRRKNLFKEINGDIAKISPYLKKFLGDNDSEISHYAAAIITGTSQKINTVCDNLRREYMGNSYDRDLAVEFIESLIVYVNSGLFAKDEVIKRRFELNSLFEKMFMTTNDIDEKYYEAYIENELMLDRKVNAIDICRQFTEKYPNREKPYYMLLKLFYVIHDKRYFFKIFSYIKENNIAYSTGFNSIIRFWEKTG